MVYATWLYPVPLQACAFKLLTCAIAPCSKWKVSTASSSVGGERISAVERRLHTGSPGHQAPTGTCTSNIIYGDQHICEPKQGSLSKLLGLLALVLKGSENPCPRLNKGVVHVRGPHLP